MATKIFISYKRGVRPDFVDRLYTFLTDTYQTNAGNEYDTFIDQQMHGGDDWWLNICTQIRGRSHFIPLISRAYFESPICLEELHFANRCYGVIIPIRVDQSLRYDEIEDKLRLIGNKSGNGNLPANIHIIDCSAEEIQETKLDEIMRAISEEPPRYRPERMELPFPPRPLSPSDTLRQVTEDLEKHRFTDVSATISQLMAIARIDGYRSDVTALVRQLETHRTYLSYRQHDDLDDLIGSLSANQPQAERQTLHAVNDLGIAAVYKDRHDAAGDILSAIDSPTTTEICLLGVSLNNFERAGGEFHEAWKLIGSLINSSSALARDLKIKILIAHPYSLGAVVRATGEDPNLAPENRRLVREVNRTADRIKALQQQLEAKSGSSLKIEARLYLTAPLLFLCWTDVNCFVQQYFFWSSHDSATMPILRFDRESANQNAVKLHAEMQNNFQMIWNHASVSLNEYLEGSHSGVETGMYQTGAVNVYTSNTESKQRILNLLENAQERVWIQGITLYSFFGKDSQLTKAFDDLVVRKNLDVQVLLLNPNCEQAKYRAYREYQILQEQTQEESVSFADYIAQDLHHRTKLYLESAMTRFEIDLLQRRAKNPKFQFKFFDSAPYCFMFIVDDHVLIEQYHYGNEPLRADGHSVGQLILGKDMPKIEYGPLVPAIFGPAEAKDKDKDELTLSKLLMNHFEFAFKTAE